MTALTMTCGEVAEALGYLHRDGRPNRQLVRRLARDGVIPQPIDMSITVAWWRWSRAEVEGYAHKGGAARSALVAALNAEAER